MKGETDFENTGVYTGEMVTFLTDFEHGRDADKKEKKQSKSKDEHIFIRPIKSRVRDPTLDFIKFPEVEYYIDRMDQT